LNSIITDNKILNKKKYSAGETYLLEMPGGIAVVVFDSKNSLLYKRIFPYVEGIKKEVKRIAFKVFKETQKGLLTKNFNFIEVIGE
jgi:hypothetical protein